MGKLQHTSSRRMKMELQQSLNEHIAEEIQADDRFIINDESKADWALKKIAEADNEIEKLERFAEAQMRQIETWLAKQTDKHLQTKEYMQSLLGEYVNMKREEDSKFKSITLPSGNVGLRANQKKWIYKDDVVLKALEQAKLDDFIKTEKKLNKQQIKKAFEVSDDKVINPDTGEVIEGIEIVDQGESLNVRLNK